MLFDALIPSLEEVGARFERGDFFVPEMLIAARAMQGALDILRPLLAETGAEPIGTFVMGTVKGDVHDIGKNLVNIMLEGAGFTVIDLGVNVAPERFVEEIEEHEPDIVGFSAFLTTTMPMFKANINALEKAGLRDKVIVMVGGAPVTQEYADAVGADGYAADASTAVRLAKALIEQQRPAAPSRQTMRVLATMEAAVKGPVCGCQMCGQCVLHSTGMTCPMTCPKTLRNGPCGGVREDGHCEVEPEMRCVWLHGYERSRRLPLPGVLARGVQPPAPAGRQPAAGHVVVGEPRHRPRPPDARGLGGRRALSRLEQALAEGRLVITGELPTVDGGGLDEVRLQLEPLAP